MTKTEYLKKLRRALRQVKAEERSKSLAYFGEVIDDRMEDGVSEQDAINELESVEAAAERIIAEAKALGQIKPRRSLWEIALIVLGFPLWFPLILTIAVVVLTVYGLVWVIIAVLFVTAAVLGVSGIAGLIGLFMLLGSNTAAAFAAFGLGLACAGLGVAVFIPALYIAKAYATATPVMWNRLRVRKDY